MGESRRRKLSITIGTAMALAGSLLVADAAVAEMPARSPLTPMADVLRTIVDQGFRKSPLAVKGLLIGSALPLTGALILLVRHLARRLGRPDAHANSVDPSLAPAPFAGPAWLAVGSDRRRRWIALPSEVHRIGRGEENDVTLTGPAAGTYAIIHRTPEHDFVVIDVSGAGGPRLAVNGTRCQRAALTNSDHIAFGSTHVTFHRGRVSGAPVS